MGCLCSKEASLDRRRRELSPLEPPILFRSKSMPSPSRIPPPYARSLSSPAVRGLHVDTLVGAGPISLRPPGATSFSPEPPRAPYKSSRTFTAPNPFWKLCAGGESVNVISSFRNAMTTELSTEKPAPVRYRPEKIPELSGIVKARVAAFQEQIDARR